VSATLHDAGEALAAIDAAIERCKADRQRIDRERTDHLATMASAESIERANALPAQRGDASAIQRLDAAVGRRRAAEDRVRVATYALSELDAEQRELESQRSASQRIHLEAARAEKAEQRKVLAHEIHGDFLALVEKMKAWRDDTIEIARMTQVLGEPRGRELPYMWKDLFSNYLHDVAPLEFDLLAPDLRPISTFVAMSMRHTAEFERFAERARVERERAVAVADAAQGEDA
jgi:hypothetical protein